MDTSKTWAEMPVQKQGQLANKPERLVIAKEPLTADAPSSGLTELRRMRETVLRPITKNLGTRMQGILTLPLLSR